MGEGDGTTLGVSEGTIEGPSLGSELGAAVGASEDTVNGSLLGSKLGTSEARYSTLVGAGDGTALGA